MLQKLRTYQNIVIWVALTVVLTAFDWPLGILSTFWQQYSFMNGVVTGLLLLGVGLFALEAWFKERELRRWKHVAYIAAKELGFVTDTLLAGMDYLLYGKRYEGDGVIFESLLHEQLTACLNNHGIFQDGKMSSRARITTLIGDRQWLDLTVIYLDRIKHQHRRNLAIWVSLIMAIDKMTPLIDNSAMANEWIFRLQDIFRAIVDRRDTRFASKDIQQIAEDRLALQVHAIQQWHVTHDGIMALQQECMRAAELVHWQHPHGQFGPKVTNQLMSNGK